MERSVYGSGHLSMASGIGRATEHEVMRSITEGEGSESHDDKRDNNLSGGDALTGHTRSHPEHDG